MRVPVILLMCVSCALGGCAVVGAVVASAAGSVVATTADVAGDAVGTVADTVSGGDDHPAK